MSARKLLTSLVILSLPCIQALANCTATWTGLGTPNNEWLTGLTGNWDMSCVPGGTATDTATFAGAAPATITLEFTALLQTLTFDSTTNYTINPAAPDDPTYQLKFEEPSTQILVSSSSSPGQIIATTVSVAMGTALEVIVDANNTLNFYDYGIGDADAMGSTVTFNGLGTTNFLTNINTPVILAPSGGVTVTDGTVTLTNNKNIAGACGGNCYGVIIGPPTIALSGGNFSTINDGNMSATGVDASGLTVTVGSSTPLTSISIDGGNWTNTNNGSINSSAVNYGILIQSTSFSMSAGSSIHSNTGSVQGAAGNVGCTLLLPSFTISGGMFSLTNSGPIQSASAGLIVDCTTGTMSNGSLILTNTDTGILASNARGCGISFSTTFTMADGYVGLFNAGTPTNIPANTVGSLILVTDTFALNGGTIENNDLVAVPTFTNGGGIQAGTGVYANPGALIAVTNVSGSTIPGSPLQSGTPGTMTIYGNYTQESGGNFTVNLQNPSTFSKLEVAVDLISGMGGTANLDGTITIQASDGYSLANGDTFLVLKAVTARNGTFATVNNLLPPGLVPTVVYVADPGVQIVIGTNVSTTIPTFPGGIVGTTISTVNQINQLNQMDRLQRLACPQVAPCSNQDKNRWWKKKQPEEKPHDCEPHPWNFYVGPLGTVGGESHSKKKQIGFDYWGAGALAGFDYVWTKFGAGLLVAYERIDAKVHRHWGKFHVDDLHASLYGKYTPTPDLAIRGIVGGSYDWYNIDRNISFPSFGIAETAKGRPQGSEFDALLGLEYTIRVGDHGQLIPLADVQYIYAAANKYKEHGAGMFDLKVHSQFIKSLRSGLGLKGNYTWFWENFSFTPEANVTWQREFSDKDRNLVLTSAVFAEPNETLAMPGIGRNIVLAGLDLVGTWYERYSLEARYNFEWNSQFHDHFLYLGVDIRF